MSATFKHDHVMTRERNYDVFKKYETVDILGQGSMGAVSKVRIKDTHVGGSAFAMKKSSLGSLCGGLFGCCLGGKSTADQDRNKFSTQRSEGHFYALKSIQLDRVSDLFLEELRNEVKILRSMDHPNIIKIHEVYNYKRQIFLVLELCDGGDLYTRSPYSERGAGKIIQDLLSAVRYMHEHGVVHRDLKFENIMFESTDPEAEIKVIDFGLSKKFMSEQPGYMSERVGTIYTMAPQVLQGIYSSKADMWSVGVISFMLLAARRPFYHKRRRKMIDQIMRCDYQWPLQPVVSDGAKDFVSKLLVLDPKERWNAAQALGHEWIVNREQLPDEKPSEEVLATVDDCLLNYRDTSALKKLALNVIAHRSTSEEIAQLRKAFDTFDTEQNGVITFEEFKEALKQSNYSDDALREIFQSVDVNKNGKIMYTEFLAATIEANCHIEEDRIADAFDRLDSDDSGYISRQNLRGILGKSCSSAKIDRIMESADENKDGRISWEEFLVAFRTTTDELATGAAQMERQSTHVSEHGLLGLDAKIPGGKYDSKLSPSLQAQADKLAT